MLGIHLLFKKVGKSKDIQIGNWKSFKVKRLLLSHRFYLFISAIVFGDFVQTKLL